MTWTSDYWDDQAASFDEEPDHGLRDATVRDAWSDLMCELLPTACSRIVDLGCGTGSLSVLMARQGHSVVGVDRSAKMIELARQKASDASVNVDFLVADAAHLNLGNARFDVVFGRHILWAFDDPGKVLNRWLDLANQDGQVVLIEGRWATGAGLTSSEVVDLFRRHGREAVVRPLADPRLWGREITDERYAVRSVS